MQRSSIAAIFALVLVSCGGGAQTADDIIDKNIEARGGYDKVMSVKTVTLEGNTIAGKSTLGMKVYYDHLKAMRTEYTAGKRLAYSILTTSNGWTFYPATDSVPIPMKDVYVKDGIFQLDVHGLFVDYKSKGYKAVYNGKDTASGKQCDKITLSKDGEGDKIYFFDDASLLQKVTSYRLMDDGKYKPSDYYLYDYRKNEQGYLFSYRRFSAGSQILFDKVTINAVLPGSLFRPHN